MTATIRGVSTERRGGNVSSDLKREYVATYLVHTDDVHDGPQTILDMEGIPSFGDRYSLGNDSDRSSIAREIRVSQRDSPDEWEVEVTFRTEDYAGQGDSSKTSPTDFAPRYSASTRSRSVYIPGRYQDPRNPNKETGFDLGVHNSAGEHFDPPPEIEIDEPVLHIQRNVIAVNWPFIMSITNAVNATDFFGCEPRTLKFSTPTIESQVDTRIGIYWSVGYSLLYKFDTWDVQILNRGTYYVPEEGASAHQPLGFEEEDGTKFYGLLKIDGQPLNKDDAKWIGKYKPDGTGDRPSFQRFRVYREVDFNTLGII